MGNNKIHGYLSLIIITELEDMSQKFQTFGLCACVCIERENSMIENERNFTVIARIVSLHMNGKIG